ncbi:hypothetical protein [Nocardioides pelophilus]|uniref:hypothetical protein n=1 Tax=Nocardioides pelophilus TaxID=2172019 RepID=UPI0015FF8923|nr:hypothetical protein [Nocardioides pelophilus]
MPVLSEHGIALAATSLVGRRGNLDVDVAVPLLKGAAAELAIILNGQRNLNVEPVPDEDGPGARPGGGRSSTATRPTPRRCPSTLTAVAIPAT